MREISRLKIKPTIKSLFDALKPKYFDTLVLATKILGKYNVEIYKYDSQKNLFLFGNPRSTELICGYKVILHAEQKIHCYLGN